MGSLPRQQRYAKDVQYKINDMKQITISIILLLLIGGTAFAQETTTQDSLIGRWEFIYPPHKSKGITHTFVYTEQKEYITVSYGGDSATITSHYYLSNEIPQEFDYNQVGKGKTGKYLVVLNVKNEASDFALCDIYEIIELTATKLRLKQLNTSVIFEYKKLE